MAILEKIRRDLTLVVNDKLLVDNLFLSFRKIAEEYISQKPVDLFQNVGLFVESSLRMAEHIILGTHTPLSASLVVDACIKKLEGVSGFDGLRIHAARLGRAIYDFRTRKKSVHLKEVDPLLIDGHLAYNICSWILIELLRESAIPEAENAVRLFFTRKMPLVQEVGGILRTTDPELSGTQRILLLLYASSDGLDEEELFESTKRKIRTKNHMRKNLKNMDEKDLIHRLPSGKWTLFGRGPGETEILISKFA